MSPVNKLRLFKTLVSFIDTHPTAILVLIICLALALNIAIIINQPPAVGSGETNHWWPLILNLIRGRGYAMCEPEYFPFCGLSNQLTASREPVPVFIFAVVALLTGQSLLAASAIEVGCYLGILLMIFLLTRNLANTMEKTPDLDIYPLTSADRDWVRRKIIESWGAEIVVVHETVYRPAELPGFVVKSGEEIAGLLTYYIQAEACEIVTLDAWREGLGIGTALIEAVKQAAGREKCRRLWLVTTNDNLPALRFYQQRGFVIAAIHVNAIEKDRRLKPEIPLIGLDGIPIRDEIELEMML